MKYYYKIAFSVFAFCIVFSFGSAQEIEKSTKTEIIGNVEYYIHTVLPGQTIYAISKAYSVSIDDIYKANPGSEKGIKAGSVLKIPLLKSNEVKSYITHTVAKGETLYTISFHYNVKVSDILAINPGLDEKIKPGQQIKIPVAQNKPETQHIETKIHVVQPGETLFAICRLYNISLDDLKKLNPGLTEIIQIGQQIKVPVVKSNNKASSKDSISEPDCSKLSSPAHFHLALLIPFYLDNSYSIDTSDLKENVSEYRSLSFIQFYEGAKIAIDSLEKTDTKMTVYVYDVNENTDMDYFLKNKTELKNANLIVGPFFINSFNKAAEWAKNNQITIVNPFTKKEDVLHENPFVFKLMPSTESQANKVLSFIADNYPNSNVLIVYRNNDSILSSTFCRLASVMATEKKKFTYAPVNYSENGYSTLTKNLSDTQINIIITLIDGEAFVASYIRNLNELAYRYKIILFGLPSWENYTSLELEYLMNLNLHIFDTHFIDYSSEETKYFVKKFRDTYYVEPDFYAFHAYDIIMYFSQVFKLYGKNFAHYIDKYNPQLLETQFKFRKIQNGGYENYNCLIYRYEDYKAINAELYPKKEILLLEKKKP